MSKFQLSGMERDTVRSLAIHQDADGLNDFIEGIVDDLVKNKILTVATGLPAPLSPLEKAVLDLVKGNA